MFRSGRGPYQALLAQQAEQQGVAHLPQVLEAHRLQLGVLHDVLQLVVEELQDSWRSTPQCHLPSHPRPTCVREKLSLTSARTQPFFFFSMQLELQQLARVCEIKPLCEIVPDRCL